MAFHPIHQRLARLAARCCAGEEVAELVATTLHFPAAPHAAWRSLLTYEEVKQPPPWWLRLLLPQPLGTHGDKTRVGNSLPCRYQGGALTKRILAVHPPQHLEFAVLHQHLGIEDCIQARVGSYHIRPQAEGSQIELTTSYTALLHPRWLWRPVEHWLGHQFHRHILSGMRASLPAPQEVPCSTWPSRLPR